MTKELTNPPTIAWSGGNVRLINQTLLPEKCVYVTCRDVKSLWNAIKQLQVRGAPAIGVAAAFGVLLGVKDFKGRDRKAFDRHIQEVCAYIGSSRPTAVNLFYGLAAMREVLTTHADVSVTEAKRLLKERAMALVREDQLVCRTMGAHGASLIKDGQSIMTVCNAGALATVDYGTALGVMYSAKAAGKNFDVFACETRPLLQGARLTTWELLRAKIKTTLICDNMAATLMKQGRVDAIFAGADRVALNGDAANKIGTYSLAVLAKYHGVPMYIVAPLSTVDPAIHTGAEIPIEERAKEEVIAFGQRPTAPRHVDVYNPAFDVTDHKLITAIVTEKGILRPPYKSQLKKLTAV